MRSIGVSEVNWRRLGAERKVGRRGSQKYRPRLFDSMRVLKVVNSLLINEVRGMEPLAGVEIIPEFAIAREVVRPPLASPCQFLKSML